jgi:hypothetical protein
VITDELHERGPAIRREMFAAEGADAQVEWSRPALTRRERSLITVAMIDGFATASRILGDDLTVED